MRNVLGVLGCDNIVDVEFLKGASLFSGGSNKELRIGFPINKHVHENVSLEEKSGVTEKTKDK